MTPVSSGATTFICSVLVLSSQAFAMQVAAPHQPWQSTSARHGIRTHAWQALSHHKQHSMGARQGARTSAMQMTSAHKQQRSKDAPDVPLLVDDSDGLGLKFEGVGAISGGGATSKLLYDYPEDVASKILDVLFKPGEGLNLHMLKVEIGGDTDSTEGAEPSHSHFKGDENYDRGYEWWLMKEAKKRNPEIKLYGLPWGWPGGLDPEASKDAEAKNVFADAHHTANYTLSWLLAAKRHHGLDIDYVGLWNEMDAPEEYRDALRDVVANSEVGSRTTVLDRIVHYPGSWIAPDAEGCQQHVQRENMLQAGEMWADEEGSMFDGRSARCLARVLNRNYVSMCKTATFQWHLISSFYDYFPWPRCGVAVANEPWSGAFEITSPLWSIAHTTQFAQIGWRYARHDAGVHMLPKGGSMVTRISPDKQDFSIVVEKIDSRSSACGHGDNPLSTPEDEEVTIQLKGAFLRAAQRVGNKLQVWRSNLTSRSEWGVNPPDSQLFQHVEPVTVDANGLLRLMVHQEHVLTLTTIQTGKKGQPESPPRTPFPVPYYQSFDDEGVGRPGRMWYDQMGAWEIQDSPYGDVAERGRVLRQVVPVWPNCWGYRCESPSSFFGPTTFKGDLTISLDVRLEDDGDVFINPIGYNYSALILSTTGTWSFGNPPVQAGIAVFTPNEWHSVKMRLRPDGSQEAFLNGKKLMPKTMSLLAVKTKSEEMQCTENNFPVPTKGQYQKGLKVFPASSIDDCRKACCLDENLCDVYQWNGETCEIGQVAEGFTSDPSGSWTGFARHESEGWHLRVRVSRYMLASIDNFKIEKS